MNFLFLSIVLFFSFFPRNSNLKDTKWDIEWRTDFLARLKNLHHQISGSLCEKWETTSLNEWCTGYACECANVSQQGWKSDKTGRKAEHLTILSIIHCGFDINFGALLLSARCLKIMCWSEIIEPCLHLHLIFLGKKLSIHVYNLISLSLVCPPS